MTCMTIERMKINGGREQSVGESTNRRANEWEQGRKRHVTLRLNGIKNRSGDKKVKLEPQQI